MAEPFQQILGIRFYVGDLPGLIQRTYQGGLIVVPSAPVLVDLAADPTHREALENSDLAVTDSGFMVLLWLLFKGRRLPRISGLRLLQALLKSPEFIKPNATFWVMPSARDAAANTGWLRGRGLKLAPEDCYVAPLYPAGRLEDPVLLAHIESRRPKFVMLNLGGGVQERLGHYLLQNLSYRPAVFCTGAAIAFLSGQQANIPPWADHLFLGWMMRTLNDPAQFFPRYRKALRLAPLLLAHGARSVAART